MADEDNLILTGIVLKYSGGIAYELPKGSVLALRRVAQIKNWSEYQVLEMMLLASSWLTDLRE
jgi:hypothetical protein